MEIIIKLDGLNQKEVDQAVKMLGGSAASIKEIPQYIKSTEQNSEEKDKSSVDVEKYTKEIERLTAEIAAFGIEKENLLKKIEEISHVEVPEIDNSKEIERLKSEIEFHKSRSDKNFEEVKKLRTAIDAISKEKKSLESAQITLKNEADKCKKESELLKAEIEKIGEDKGIESSSAKELEDREAEIVQLKKENDKLKSEVEFHRGRSDKNFDEVKKLRTAIDSLNKEKSTYGNEVSKLEEDIVRLKAENSNLVLEMENQTSFVPEPEVDENLISELRKYERIKELIFSKNKGREFWEGIEKALDEE